MIIKEFDPQIYPIKLFVSVVDNFKNLNGLFHDENDNKELTFDNFENYKAITVKGRNGKNGFYGILIAFRPKFLDYNTIAHEAAHAAGYICYHTGMDMDCGEATAYLIEWIVKCCWSLRKK